MKTVIHKANTRGQADYGWLKTHHTFSFSRYYHPERMNFGKLRVLNDDVVKGGKGFGTHPHENMEIVSIPLKGALEHKDSMGHISVIRENEVQIMSAGTGVTHSEYNHSKTEEVNFLQVWILPKEEDITPHYDQKLFAEDTRKNHWQVVVSPQKSEDTLWINQEAYFSLVDLDKGTTISYEIKKVENGVYIFVIEGDIQINQYDLSQRDGIGIWDVENVTIEAFENARLVAIEVPMN